MSPETFVVFLIATLAVNLSPGPSILYVSSVAAANGFQSSAVLGPRDVGRYLFSCPGGGNRTGGVARGIGHCFSDSQILRRHLSRLSGRTFAPEHHRVKQLLLPADSDNVVGFLPSRCSGRPPESKNWYVFHRLSTPVSRSRRNWQTFAGAGPRLGVHCGGWNGQRLDWFSGLERRHLHRACRATLGRTLDWGYVWRWPRVRL